VTIFPWIKWEMVALAACQHLNPMAKDIALAQFLALLQWLWRILLQDTALLYTHNPLYAVLRYPPFNTPLF
jgi:hypothetical protein